MTLGTRYARLHRILKDNKASLKLKTRSAMQFFVSFTSQDPVVRRGDNFIPGINHAIPRIQFSPGLTCVVRSGDKFILGINRANPGIKLTQQLSRVKSLSRCFFVMKHYKKQFCRYTCFSNNIPEQHQHFSFSHESQFLSQGKENTTQCNFIRYPLPGSST